MNNNITTKNSKGQCRGLEEVCRYHQSSRGEIHVKPALPLKFLEYSGGDAVRA